MSATWKTGAKSSQGSTIFSAAIFGTYRVAEFANPFSHSWIDRLGNFLRHLRQNGELGEIESHSIAINDERAQAEIEDPSLKDSVTTNRPTPGGILRLFWYKPTPPPLINASDAPAHLREHRRVKGTVTEIEANRRGDVILRIGSPPEPFKLIIPASCDLSKEHEWIDSLKYRALTFTGLISFYAQGPAHLIPIHRINDATFMPLSMAELKQRLAAAKMRMSTGFKISGFQ